MIKLKTEKEIAMMIEGGRRLRKVVSQLKRFIRPQMTTREIDRQAEYLIKINGGEPSFKKVKGYHWTTCLSINDQVVHTPPSLRRINDGDILTLDVGFYYQGFHTDFSDTFIVGKPKKDQKIDKFLQVGKETLKKAIKQFKENNHIGHISQVIEEEIRGHGYFVIKSLTGHGIGKQLHEDPYILGYLDRPISSTPLIEKGLVAAIEIIYSLGSEEIMTEKGSHWSLVTTDGSPAACFEQTVAVSGKNTIILT